MDQEKMLSNHSWLLIVIAITFMQCTNALMLRSSISDNALYMLLFYSYLMYAFLKTFVLSANLRLAQTN